MSTGAPAAAERDQPDSAADARFRAAVARFDAANAEDPGVAIIEGRSLPAALLYGIRMTQSLSTFAPQASEALQLAVRAQHLMRWAIPRTDYPPGRKGYHQWRTALARFHAEQAGEILGAVGYAAAVVDRVQSLLRKERIKLDAEAQCLEDVACLVFLEHHLAHFMGKHEPDKVVDILRKTWRKMSPQGQQAALGLSLPAAAQALVKDALEL